MIWLGITLAVLQTEASPVARITAITLSRSGLAEVTREIDVRAGTREYVLREVPMAIDGTFWFEGLDGCRVLETRTRLEFKDWATKTRLVAFGDILANNIGRTVSIKTAPYNRDPENVTGIVRYVGPPTIALATLEQKNGTLRTVRIPDIQEVAAKGLNLYANVHESKPELSLRLKASAPTKGRIAIHSIEPGLAWTPSYRITLEDDASATVLAKFQVASSSQKLKDARLTLIASEVSLPKNRVGDLSAGTSDLEVFVKGGAMPPRRPTDSLRDPFQLWYKRPSRTQTYAGYQYYYGGGGLGGGGFGGAGGAGGEYDESYSYQPPYGEQKQEVRRIDDLYTIPCASISLDPGDRVARELFRATVNYRNYYRWETGVPRASQSTGERSVSSFNRILRIETKERTPLPSGLCLVMKGGVPMAQVVLPFTPPQLPVDLDLGQLADIPVEFQETMVSRERVEEKTATSTYSYMKQTTEASFVVTNPRNEPIEVELRFNFWGHLTTPFEGRTQTWNSLGQNGNPGQSAIWPLKVAAGASERLRFRYWVRTY